MVVNGFYRTLTLNFTNLEAFAQEMMFIKPFRVKSQTQLKSSERKKLATDILKNFTDLSEDDLSKIFPPKAEVMVSKVYCSRGEMVHVYQIMKEPMVFKIDKDGTDQLYPTVYFLWHFPNALKTFTTHPPVINRLLQGADLMLPGIEMNGPITLNSYGKFEKGTIVAINTTDNTYPQSVGKTAHSSTDMYMAARHGKGVVIIHVYRDLLWEMGSKSLVPVMSPSETPSNIIDHFPEDEAEMIETLEIKDDAPTLDENISVDVKPSVVDAESVDNLFVHCFIKAWKTSAKKLELPILTSNFYRLHMVPSCPDNYTLEIKKSSYKKLSKFLGAMAKRNYVQVKEFPKGVENIIAVNFAHEDFKNFVVDESETTKQVEASSSNANSKFSPPVMEELYQVSGTTVEFFRKNKLCKGDVLSKAEIREIITDYITKKDLKKQGQVELDPIMHAAIVNPKEGYKEFMRWDEIFSRFLGKMSSAFRITRAGQVPIIRKGKLESIELAVAKRSGNKKVTLIYNVGIFGIDEQEFAHQIQVGVAASTSVGPADHKPMGTTQVLVQGNQVTYISKLLLDTYQIPKKYIKGLELAPKGKK